MTPSKGILSAKLPYNGSDSVIVGNGTRLPIHHVGQVHLSTSVLPLTLNNVLYVPKLKYNLLFVQKLCKDHNCEVGFDSSIVHVKDKATGTTLLPGTSDGGAYLLSTPISHSAFLPVSNSRDVWHRRLDHCGSRVLDNLRHKNFISLTSKFSNNCVSCKLGKAHRLPFHDAGTLL